ncbi:MAG: gamma-glutamylcyclotransferase [Xanthobacteraceae bacterium]|nr:gamma-glutamylcyclotransferase [Xanthobacteraceae bacterium]
MTLHFAYGSNMSRTHMRARCPGAAALGTATLAGWRFVINPDGYGSIAPESGGIVHGVLWRLTARDLAAVDAYENVAGGLYVRRRLPVLHDGKRVTALTYIATRQGEGTPRPGYVAIVLAAARDWELPEPYIRSLMRWSPSAFGGTRSKETGEAG